MDGNEGNWLNQGKVEAHKILIIILLSTKIKYGAKSVGGYYLEIFHVTSICSLPSSGG